MATAAACPWCASGTSGHRHGASRACRASVTTTRHSCAGLHAAAGRPSRLILLPRRAGAQNLRADAPVPPVQAVGVGTRIAVPRARGIDPLPGGNRRWACPAAAGRRQSRAAGEPPEWRRWQRLRADDHRAGSAGRHWRWAPRSMLLLMRPEHRTDAAPHATTDLDSHTVLRYDTVTSEVAWPCVAACRVEEP